MLSIESSLEKKKTEKTKDPLRVNLSPIKLQIVKTSLPYKSTSFPSCTMFAKNEQNQY